MISVNPIYRAGRYLPTYPFPNSRKAVAARIRRRNVTASVLKGIRPIRILNSPDAMKPTATPDNKGNRQVRFFSLIEVSLKKRVWGSNCHGLQEIVP